ncbi:hypothetical protein F8E02_03570 [Methanoculleus sp. Wushi-C6]|uniref:Uncharacterized protein n=1 Tax=Methanoculleus caldifontis TaxID=2651577 RepID=A0ABU3WZ73_9EURY|nr:hypothetical protein [Methanoculleus sp. Wushi-C6]
MDLKAPKLPKLPKITVSRRQALIAVGAAVALIAVVFIGWNLYLDHTKEQRVAAFGSHMAASEADLHRLHEAVSTHMRSSPDHLSIGETDAYMRQFGALAEYGRGVTAYHRQVIAADVVPMSYAGAQAAYIRALESLNRAFSLWSSAAAAYDAKAYAAAKDNLKEADGAWKEYLAAVEEYERELRAAESGEEISPA